MTATALGDQRQGRTEPVEVMAVAIRRCHPFPFAEMNWRTKLRFWWKGVRHPFAFVDSAVAWASEDFAKDAIAALEAAGWALVPAAQIQEQAKSRLLTIMEDISEGCFCAGWMNGLEFDLWDMVQGGPREYGMGEVSEDEVEELRRLSEQAGGWWRYGDDGREFVSLEDWRARLASRPAPTEDRASDHGAAGTPQGER